MGQQRITLRDERGVEHEVVMTDANSVTLRDRTASVHPVRPGELRVANHTVWVATDDDRRWVFVNGQTYLFELQRPGNQARRPVGHDESLSAPMPATVVKVHVAPGDEVKAGQLLVVLEAMKMELPVRASRDARVDSIRCREGELVQPGQPLLELTPHVPAASSDGGQK